MLSNRRTDLLNVARWERYTLLILLAILLLAAGQRILHIGDQSLWLDEGIAYWNQKQPDMIGWMAEKDVHPPLYFWLLHLWIGLTGSSDVAMRMFSALASLISVAAVVPLAKLLARDRRREERWAIPILAALLLTLSDPEISLAQDVRMYALRTLMALGSTFFYLRWIRRGTPLRTALWVGTLVALYHTNYIGAYMGVIHGLHALIFLRGRQRIGAVALLALSAALFLPWFIGYGIGQQDTDTGINAALPSNWDTLVEIGFKYFTQMWSLMIGLALLGLVRFEDGRFRWRPLDSTFLLSIWIGFTVVVTFVVNFWLDFLSPRRLLLVSPALAILTARGLAHFRMPARLFLVGAILVYALATVDDYYPKPPWEDVANNLARYAQPGELIVMEIYRDDFTMDYYIDHLFSLEMPRESLRLWREDRAAEYPQALIAQIDQAPSVWLVHWSPDRSAFSFLEQTGHVQTAKMTVDHIGNALDLYRFDRLPAEPVDNFANGMTLRQAVLARDAGRVDLWWSADETLGVDYTTSVFLLDESGRLAAQHDAFPFEDRRPTATWAAGEVVYDPHPLELDALPPGRYTIAAQVYTWQDGVKQLTSAGDPWVVLGDWQF
ncbi:MAG: glycosyltransferase family 39 protein [Anaerolineae bacterium]|nr:glycosyltransferase family 39 protein [Anaerolineae bacterium]